MTEDATPGRRPPPDRLWTDPREEEEHQPWLQPRAPASAAPSAHDEPTAVLAPPRRRLWPVILLTSLAALLLVASGVVATRLLDRSDELAKRVTALPASPGAAPADARSKSVRAIYANASPSVVSVRVRDGGAQSSGTGFLIDRDGTVVTNAHVVGSADEVQVQLDDRSRPLDARVLGTDASSDLAVVSLGAGAVDGLTPLTLADSEQVQVGDLAVAIGFPLGLDRTMTQGIVSGVGRAIEAPNGFQIDKVIQTDAPINPGNSGGPLLDSLGRVIGVNSQIATAGAGGGNVGIGFAVPANTVREVVPRLRAGAPIMRPYLGVSTLGSTVGSGALVADVIGGGPAAAGGVRVGDLIQSVGGRPIEAPEDVSAAIENREPGDRVAVEVERAGATQQLSVTLGTRPERVSTP